MTDKIILTLRHTHKRQAIGHLEAMMETFWGPVDGADYVQSREEVDKFIEWLKTSAPGIS